MDPLLKDVLLKDPKAEQAMQQAFKDIEEERQLLEKQQKFVIDNFRGAY